MSLEALDTHEGFRTVLDSGSAFLVKFTADW